MEPLSRAGWKALEIAQANPQYTVYAGTNYHVGRLVTVNHKSLIGLTWRGLAVDVETDDNDSAVQLTTAGIRLFPDEEWEL